MSRASDKGLRQSESDKDALESTNGTVEDVGDDHACQKDVRRSLWNECCTRADDGEDTEVMRKAKVSLRGGNTPRQETRTYILLIPRPG